MFKIKKIKIQNFKIFPEITLDFEEASLVIFDGPNGFGKTTVFDAIEFLLTGKISRLVSYDKNSYVNQKTKRKLPIANKNDIDLIVTAALRSVESEIELSRVIEKKQLQSEKTGGLSWDKSRLYLQDIKAGIAKKEITQDELNTLLGIEKLENNFNTFFYVQQEENTSFLKQTENAKKDAISFLFNTKQEEDFLVKLNKLVFDLTKRKNGNISKIGEIDNQFKNFKSADEVISEANYEKILDLNQSWNHEKINFKESSYIKMLEELNSVKSLLEKKEPFLNQKRFVQYSKYFETQDGPISYVVSLFPDDKRAEALKELTTWKTCKELNEELGKQGDKRKTIKDSSDFLKNVFEKEMNNFQTLLSEIVIKEKESSEIALLETKITSFRDNLLELHRNHSLKKNQGEKECPFCGHEWKNLEELVQSFNKHGVRFKQTVNQELEVLSKSLEASIEVVVTRISEKAILIGKIGDFLKESLLEFDKKLSKVKSIASVVAKMDAKFSVDDLELTESEKMDSLAAELTRQALIYLKTLDNLDKEEYEKLNLPYVTYFQQAHPLLESVDVESIEKKQAYVKKLYGEYVTSETKSLSEQKSKLEEENKLLSAKETKLKKIAEVYRNEIREHMQKIVDDISIPFYINSGRILQEYFGGKGVFIEMGSNISDGVKFYNELDKQHDPLYTMSSGQLSAIVLALCLTLNDVYKEHRFSPILIDDPVQTMDEINMLSFVELLRSNFQDRQIIISTHENKFADLIHFKFDLAGMKVRKIQMKDFVVS